MFGGDRHTHSMSLRRRVIVIGAGTAGICAAKTVVEYGLEVQVYEQSDRIGGNWNYTDRVGPDEYGLATGKEVMAFPDLPIQTEDDHSFLNQEEVLDYLKHYVQHFDVGRHIKFRHEVIRVQPRRDGRWEVIVRDVVNNEYKTERYDFVMICTGHHWSPRYPNFKGESLFKGNLKHSYEFRKKEEYEGQRVCVVGSGSSSVDIALMLCEVCPEVVYSQHYPYTKAAVFPRNLRLVADLAEVTETGVLLKDGTRHDVDAILYCTGLNYSYPFLTTDSGIVVDDNYVSPLYKQLININHTTMAFIGLHYHLCIQLVMDLQARFCLKFWSTDRQFPSRQEMLQECDRNLKVRLAKGWKKRHGHRIWDMHEEYNNDLATTADVPGIDPVYLKVYFDAMGWLRKDYGGYRAAQYRILDRENYLKIDPEQH